MRKTSLPTLCATALIAVGCGDSDSDETGPAGGQAAERSATPAQAVAEIGQVRAGLQEGLAQYRQGDAKQADETIGDAYLEHFEIVEGPLGKVDEELNEGLEGLIRETLRSAIQDGAPPGEVAALVSNAQRQLDEAEKALSK